jgi:hypothetical protein
MPLSTTSAFSDPSDFRSALRHCGVLQLTPGEGTGFRARLTNIRLDQMELIGGTETIPREARVSMPLRLVLIEFPKMRQDTHYWGEQQIRLGQLAIVSGVNGINWRTSGPTRWGAVLMQADVLTRYVHTMHGGQAPRPAPGVTLTQPSRTTFGELLRLHNAAVRYTVRQPEAPVESESARGLEQELVTLLTELLLERSRERQ